jgi:hypothetical protein
VDAKRSKRRFVQFSLRGALLAITVIALGLVAWRIYMQPYRDQQNLMHRIEALGGRYTTETGGPAWLRKLLGDGHFQEITLADVANANPADYLEAIIHLPRLETLVVGGEEFTDAELARLARLKSLRAVVLDSTDVTDEAIAALRNDLPDLIVHRSQRRDIAALERARTFLASEKKWRDQGLPKLRELIGDEHFQLVTRVVSYMGVANGDQELAALRRLTSLDAVALNARSAWVAPLPKNAVTDAGLEQLVRLPNLKSLGLADTLVTDDGLRYLQALANLEHLSLESNPQITSAAMPHVGKLMSLRTLFLQGTSVDDVGLQHVHHLLQLENLRLEGTKITNDAVDALASLSRLEFLGIGNTAIDDAGARKLERFTSLRQLSCKGSKISPEGKTRLLRALPKLSID